jgi:tetratricopeptide (TPR) repeat protein
MYLCNERYKVIGRLGGGGFSKVYLAEDRILHKTWAVKEMSVRDIPNLAENELDILTKVSHPGIVRITDVFKSDDRIFIVMDHVEGMDLGRLMRSGRKISQRTKLKWLNEICDALCYLHGMEQPVVVRDLKPGNIMIRPDGHAVLIDFGAASDRAATVDDYVFGSRGYAAPEQIAGRAADERSDIYALGRVIEFLTGERASPWLKLVVKKCTADDPGRRYRNVAAVKRGLIIVSSLKYAVLAVAVIVMTAAVVSAHMGKSNAAAIDMARMEQAYAQALMCFYDMQDYDSASKYLDEVSEEIYPETVYYRRIAELYRDNCADAKEIGGVLKEFEEFNEEHIDETGTDRYVKNVLCMASAYLTSDDTAGEYKAERVIRQALGKNGNEKLSEREESALLDMLTGILVERVRENGEAMEESKDEIVRNMDRQIQIAEDTGDTGSAVTWLMDKAAFLTECDECEEAVATYAVAEEEYPGNEGLRYAPHMMLMMKLGYDSRDVRHVWDLAVKAGATKDDPDYDMIKERMEAYEKNTEKNSEDDIEDEQDTDTFLYNGRSGMLLQMRGRSLCGRDRC